jgi:hypothetical protein
MGCCPFCFLLQKHPLTNLVSKTHPRKDGTAGEAAEQRGKCQELHRQSQALHRHGRAAPELLHTFVAKIIVYEKEGKYSKHSPRKFVSTSGTST